MRDATMVDAALSPLVTHAVLVTITHCPSRTGAQALSYYARCQNTGYSKATRVKLVINVFTMLVA